MTSGAFDPLDFQPNSVGVLVVRVIRLKDIARTLGCDDAQALEVVREIRGETSADERLAFVLPSQLAAWAYQRAGKPAASFPSRTLLMKEESGREDVLKRAAAMDTSSSAGSTSLKEIRSDLRRLKSATIQPGAVTITIAQTAARLGCAKTKVFELLKSGELKRGKRVGRSTMVLVSSIDAFAAAGVVRRPTVQRNQQAGPETAAEILKKLRQPP